MKFYLYIIIVCLLISLVSSKYSCREVDDCMIYCLNIPSQLIYNLKNISSEWFPVLLDNDHCYLYNKLTDENELF